MTLILRARRFGFSLEEIRQWLEIYESHGTDAQMQDLIGRADERLEVLAKERSDLDAAITDLQKLRDDIADSLDSSRPVDARR
jgi:DNA-binding transcriptional MerR regulator